MGASAARRSLARPSGSILPKEHLLSYLEAIMRVYNQLGRRDNLYKSRIKILVNQTGAEEFAPPSRGGVGGEIKDGALHTSAARKSIASAHTSQPPSYESVKPSPTQAFDDKVAGTDSDFAGWVKTNVARSTNVPGYAIVNISLKATGEAPGDATAEQMDVGRRPGRALFGLDEIRVSHEQNLVLALREARPMSSRSGLGICSAPMAWRLPTSGSSRISSPVPGLDYCNLANARAIPVAQRHLGSGSKDLEPAARYRRAQGEDLRLHQCLRSPSCRPYRNSRRRQEGSKSSTRSRSAAAPTRPPSSARFSAPLSRSRKSAEPSKRSSKPTSRSARKEKSSTRPSPAWASSLSREKIYASH